MNNGTKMFIAGVAVGMLAHYLYAQSSMGGE